MKIFKFNTTSNQKVMVNVDHIVSIRSFENAPNICEVTATEGKSFEIPYDCEDVLSALKSGKDFINMDDFVNFEAKSKEIRERNKRTLQNLDGLF